MPHSQSHTVVVENPMSVDESGKLVTQLLNSFTNVCVKIVLSLFSILKTVLISYEQIGNF